MATYFTRSIVPKQATHQFIAGVRPKSNVPKSPATLSKSTDFGVLMQEMMAQPVLPVLREKFDKRLTNSFQPPIEIAPADLAAYAAAFAAACGPSLQAIVADAMRRLDSDFGTHTPKFPNLNIVLHNQNALMRSNTVPSSHGCTSSNTHLRRRFLCAGDANHIPCFRLLCTVFTYQGVTQSAAEDFAAQGPLYHEMDKLTPLAALSLALRNRMQHPSVVQDGRSKNGEYGGVPTIYWPVSDGPITRNSDFHLISVVTNTGMIAEIITRRIEQGLQFGRTHEMKVGGTQPQNGGLLNMNLRGFVPHLRSEPPPHRATRRLDLYDDLQTLDRFRAPDGTLVRNNKAVKEARTRVIHRIVHHVLDDLRDPPFGQPQTPDVETIMVVVLKSAAKIQGLVMGDDVIQDFKQAATSALNDL